MGEIHIQRLEKDVSKETFDCGNNSINNMIFESYYPTLLQHAYTYEVTSVNASKVILGYFMILFKTLPIEECPDDISGYFCDFVNSCCALHIKCVAVQKKYQNRMIGTSIVKTIVKHVLDLSKRWPVLLITIDALKEKIEWYKKLGFLPFKEEDIDNMEPTITMYIDCISDRSIVKNYIEQL